MSGLTRVAIVGAGGFAREVLDVVEARSDLFTFEGFLVDNEHGESETLLNGAPILGGLSWLTGRSAEIAVLCAVEFPRVRRRVVAQAKSLGASFFTAIHPDVRMSRWVRIGEGSVICAGTVLTNQIEVGAHTHINLNCTVGHDARIEDYVNLSPGVHVSGNVTIGEGAYLGTGTNIIEHRRIGRWSIVGAGSAVVEDVPANTTAVGVPARTIKVRSEGWHTL